MSAPNVPHARGLSPGCRCRPTRATCSSAARPSSVAWSARSIGPSPTRDGSCSSWATRVSERPASRASLRFAPPRSASRCAGGAARRPRAHRPTGRGCRSSALASGSSRSLTLTTPRRPRSRRCSRITRHDHGTRPVRSRHTRGFSSSRRSRARWNGSVPKRRCSSCSTTCTGPTPRRCSCCASLPRSSPTHACSSSARTATSRCGGERAPGCSRTSRAESAILVGGLAEADVARLLAARTRRTLPDDLVSTVHQVSDGNPFFVEELARTLEAAPEAPSSALRIPDQARDVVRYRLRPLSERGQLVLRVGSVLGQEFEVTPLAAVAGLAPHDALAALDEAALLGIVSASGPAPDTWRFAHALVRETVYGDLSAAERVRLHHGVGEQLESLGPAEATRRLPELAHHFASSASLDRGAKATTYARAAGEQALARLAYEEAAAYFGQAIKAVGFGDIDAGTRIRLILQHADALWRANETAAARAASLQATEMARGVDGSLFAEAVMGYAANLHRGDRATGSHAAGTARRGPHGRACGRRASPCAATRSPVVRALPQPRCRGPARAAQPGGARARARDRAMRSRSPVRSSRGTSLSSAPIASRSRSRWRTRSFGWRSRAAARRRRSTAGFSGFPFS